MDSINLLVILSFTLSLSALAFSFHGHTKKNGIQKIRVLLTLKNKFQREIEIPVEGGYSSLILLTLR
jgi:hypothetical protein